MTFEEARAHLGGQSQRQWSKAPTTRTTPVLFALFSLVCLMANRLHALTPLVPHTTAWYAKPELTFSDLLWAVRTALWRARVVPRLAPSPDPALSLEAEREQLNQLLAPHSDWLKSSLRSRGSSLYLSVAVTVGTDFCEDFLR